MAPPPHQDHRTLGSFKRTFNAMILLHAQSTGGMSPRRRVHWVVRDAALVTAGVTVADPERVTSLLTDLLRMWTAWHG